MHKSNTDMAVGDIVKYTRNNSFMRANDHPRKFNPDNPYGEVLEVLRDAARYPSARVKWDNTGEISWAFLSSLLIVTDVERRTGLSWARSYLQDEIYEHHRMIQVMQNRLDALP